MPGIFHFNSWKICKVDRKQNTYKLEMVLKPENHELLLQKQFVQLTKGIQKIGHQCCILRIPGISHFNSWKIYNVDNKQNTYKFYMIFKRENHDSNFKQFMNLTQRNPKNKTPIQYSTNPGICHSNSWKKYKVDKKQNTYKLEMVSKRENHELLLQKQFRQPIKRIQKIGHQSYIIQTPGICHSNSWKKV